MSTITTNLPLFAILAIDAIDGRISYRESIAERQRAKNNASSSLAGDTRNFYISGRRDQTDITVFVLHPQGQVSNEII